MKVVHVGVVPITILSNRLFLFMGTWRNVLGLLFRFQPLSRYPFLFSHTWMLDPVIGVSTYGHGHLCTRHTALKHG
jgi:hypothetical protein